MKRLVLMTMLIIGASAMYAYDYLGVQVGYSQSITRLNAPITGKETVLDPTTYNGMKIGLVYDATIVKGFGVTMGLNYTFGGNVTNWTQKFTTALYPKIRSRGQYHQLEIPVDWQYKFEIAKHTWVILYTGPTLQCGILMNDKWYLNDGKDINFTHDENIYSVDDMGDYALKRLNVTWGVGAGFQYERYFLRGGYDFGLINPYKVQSFTGQDIYTRGRFDQWQIKLGMYLWESK